MPCRFCTPKTTNQINDDHRLELWFEQLNHDRSMGTWSPSQGIGHLKTWCLPCCGFVCLNYSGMCKRSRYFMWVKRFWYGTPTGENADQYPVQCLLNKIVSHVQYPLFNTLVSQSHLSIPLNGISILDLVMPHYHTKLACPAIVSLASSSISNMYHCVWGTTSRQNESIHNPDSACGLMICHGNSHFQELGWHKQGFKQ